jgi:methylmalonyl-CoA/ethylmalonyl-CoA epimerase
MLTRIHHIGLVVRDLTTAYRFWRDAVGLEVHKEATVPDQGVKAALLPCGETEIELLEPIDPQGGVAKFLEKRGEGLHHLCFEADDVARELAQAKARGLPMIDEKPRQGLAGMIGFLHPKASCGCLVEFAQPPAGAAVAHRTGIAFDHIAIVVDDVAQATDTFARNYGLATDTAAKAGPIRMPLSESALHFFSTGAAPVALREQRGLAGIGLRLTDRGGRLDRIRASAAESEEKAGNGDAPYGTKAHGVPLTFLVAA